MGELSEKVMTNCLQCGAELQKPKTGRHPSYCSVGCRRSAEYEITRLNRRIDSFENDLAHERGLQGPFPDICDGFGRHVQDRVNHLQKELGAAENRLRLLLNARAEVVGKVLKRRTGLKIL